MKPKKMPRKLKMRASWRLEYMVMISPFISAFLAYNKETQHDNNTVVSLLRDHSPGVLQKGGYSSVGQYNVK